jgi:hypothetical protein
MLFAVPPAYSEAVPMCTAAVQLADCSDVPLGEVLPSSRDAVRGAPLVNRMINGQGIIRF